MGKKAVAYLGLPGPVGGTLTNWMAVLYRQRIKSFVRFFYLLYRSFCGNPRSWCMGGAFRNLSNKNPGKGHVIGYAFPVPRFNFRYTNISRFKRVAWDRCYVSSLWARHVTSCIFCKENGA